MSNRMSASQYRKQFVEPALEEEKQDAEFMNKVVGNNKKKTNKVVFGQSEHQIQNRILERLGFLNKGFFWRENSGKFQLEHEGKKRFFRAGINGIADIMGVYNGFPVAIEVKAPGKKPSLNQIAFMNRFKECGGIAFVCDDDTKVVEMLEQEIIGKRKLLKRD